MSSRSRLPAEYLLRARNCGLDYCGTAPGTMGPLEAKLRSYPPLLMLVSGPNAAYVSTFTLCTEAVPRSTKPNHLRTPMYPPHKVLFKLLQLIFTWGTKSSRLTGPISAEAVWFPLPRGLHSTLELQDARIAHPQQRGDVIQTALWHSVSVEGGQGGWTGQVKEECEGPGPFKHVRSREPKIGRHRGPAIV